MLSPKNHIRGESGYSATDAGKLPIGTTKTKKAGVKPAFLHSMRAVHGQYFAMTGPPNL
jgi:hypothetical protein